jgi:hypothetical protein
MSKTKITGGLLILGIAVVGLVGGTVLVKKRAELTPEAARRKEAERAFGVPTKTQEESKIPAQEKVKLYQDEAGFSFNYLSSLVVTEATNQDENTYSSLEIFSSFRPGEKMTIKVLDSDYSTVEEWLKKNRGTDSQVNEAVMSGINGKTLRTSTQTTTVVINNGIIVLVESPKDNQNFWSRHHQVIVDSLKVNWPGSQGGTASSETEVVEEEVIE